MIGANLADIPRHEMSLGMEKKKSTLDKSDSVVDIESCCHVYTQAMPGIRPNVFAGQLRSAT
jgi:hypothetical protein